VEWKKERERAYRKCQHVAAKPYVCRDIREMRKSRDTFRDEKLTDSFKRVSAKISHNFLTL